MKNKKIIIGVVTAILIILIVGSIIYINITGDSINVSISEEITLSDEEQEIIDIVRKIDDKLKNPSVSEENTNTIDFELKNTEATTFKDLFNNIYEARKYMTEEGKTSYVFQVGIKSEEQLEDDKRFLIYNEEGIYYYPTLEDLNLEETTENSNGINKEETDGGLTITMDFYGPLFESLEEELNEIWQNSITYNSVDYNKIYNMI